MNKVHARGKRSKQPASKAAKVGTTAVDRRLLAQADRETAEGKAAKAPAKVLRDAKARIDEANKVPIPKLPGQEHPATAAAREAGKARQEVGALVVPMTLAEICEVIGVNCQATDFASTALETLAGQVAAVQCIVERENVDPYEGYRLLANIAERMKLASRVTAWLEHESPLVSLPEVAP